MPEAVLFLYQDKLYKIFFTQKNAVLPIKTKTGKAILLPWGRRAAENSLLPFGGWVRLPMLSFIKETGWTRYFPKLVKLPILKFMEKDFEGKTHWYEVTKGKCLQGVLAREQKEFRLYIVTIDPEDVMNQHYRWPYVVAGMEE